MENEVKFVDCIELTLTTFVIMEEFQMVRFRTLVTVAVARSQPLPLFWETQKSVAGKLSWKKNIIGNVYVYSAII